MSNILQLEQLKFCPKCSTSKKLLEFSKCKTNKDELAYQCRKCCKNERDNRKDKSRVYFQKYYSSISDKETIFKNIRSNTAKRGEIMDLTIDDIPTIPLFCPVLGIPISVKSKNRNNSVSVDRIDNSKGYVKGNIVLISYKANRCKSNLSFEQIEKMYLFYKQFQDNVTISPQ